MNKRPAKKQDLVDLANGIQIEIGHLSCKDGKLRFNSGDFNCTGCTGSWKFNWLAYRATEKQLEERFYVKLPDDKKVYKLVEVTEGKIKFYRLVEVEKTYQQELEEILNEFWLP